jgi:hypothetical protein
MSEALNLIWEFALHCWQLWGVTVFFILPLFLGVIAIWEFSEWLEKKGGKR